jgi:cytochrome c oxidase subunit 3
MSQAVPAQQKLWGGGKSPYGVSYGKLMMWFFLMSDAFTFGSFLISLWTIRFSGASWPDPNHVFSAFPGLSGDYPLLFVSLMTFILIISSVTMVLSVQAGHRMDRKGAAFWLFWTIIGGLAFLGCQAWEWTHLYHEGAWWGRIPTEVGSHFLNRDGSIPSTNFSNYFFTVTGFHGFHVFSGVVINVIVLIMILRGVFDRRGHYEMIEKIGLYWHFVDLVWVFVFTCYYLL